MIIAIVRGAGAFWVLTATLWCLGCQRWQFQPRSEAARPVATEVWIDPDPAPPPMVEPARVDEVVEPAEPATYTIQRGDTLWSIAQRVYGDGQRWRDIIAVNPGLDATRLRVGQQIVLP